MKLKEGHRDGFLSVVEETAVVARGLGWGGTARMFVELGLDRQFVGRGKRRIRLKRMKRILKRVFVSKLLEHVEELR